MDQIFIQIHIIGKEKIFLLIWIRDYKWQPLKARLWTGETESPTWASTTSILHHFYSKLTSKRKSWEEHNSAPRDKGMQTQAQVPTTMDYSYLALNSSCLQCIQRVPYIALQWGNGRSNLSDLKAYGRSTDKWLGSTSRKTPKHLAFCTHPNVHGRKGYIHVYMWERV